MKNDPEKLHGVCPYVRIECSEQKAPLVDGGTGVGGSIGIEATPQYQPVPKRQAIAQTLILLSSLYDLGYFAGPLTWNFR